MIRGFHPLINESFSMRGHYARIPHALHTKFVPLDVPSGNGVWADKNLVSSLHQIESRQGNANVGFDADQHHVLSPRLSQGILKFSRAPTAKGHFGDRELNLEGVIEATHLGGILNCG